MTTSTNQLPKSGPATDPETYAALVKLAGEIWLGRNTVVMGDYLCGTYGLTVEQVRDTIDYLDGWDIIQHPYLFLFEDLSLSYECEDDDAEKRSYTFVDEVTGDTYVLQRTETAQVAS